MAWIDLGRTVELEEVLRLIATPQLTQTPNADNQTLPTNAQLQDFSLVHVEYQQR